MVNLFLKYNLAAFLLALACTSYAEVNRSAGVNFTGVYKPGNTYSDCSFSATATAGKGSATCSASFNLSGFNIFTLSASPPSTNEDASTNLFNSYSLGGSTRSFMSLGSYLIGKGVLTERTLSVSNSQTSCAIATSPQNYNWIYTQTRGVYSVPSSSAMGINSIIGGTLVHNSNGYDLNGTGGIEAGTEALTQFTSTSSFTLSNPNSISTTPYNIVYKTNDCVQDAGGDTAQRTYKKGAAPYSQISPLGGGGIMNVGEETLLFTDTQAIPTVAIATPVLNLTATYGNSGHGYETQLERDVLVGIIKQAPQDADTFVTAVQTKVSFIADSTQSKFIIREIDPTAYSSRTQGTVLGSIAWNTITYDLPSTGFWSGTFSRTYNATTYTGYVTCLPGLVKTQNWLVCQIQGTISGHWDNRVLTSLVVAAPRSTAVRFLPTDIQNDAANSNGANQACANWTVENLSPRSVASIAKSTVSPWPAKWDLGATAFSSNNTGTDCKDYIPGFSSCTFQVCLNGTNSGVSVGAHFDALAFRVDDDGAGGDNDGNGSAYEEDVGIAYGVNDEFQSALVAKVGATASNYFVLVEGTHTSGSPMDVDIYGRLEMDNSIQDISAVILGFPSIPGTLGTQGGITTDYSYNSGYTETTYLRRGADNLKFYLTGTLPGVGKFSETYSVPGSTVTVTYILNKDTDSDGAYDWSFTTPAAATVNADNCPNTSNGNQLDTDSDGLGDTCDNCPAASNLAQTDSDSDAVGDACDNCVSTSNANQADGDSDGVGTACDNCVSTINANQADGDSDGVGTACDNCVSNSNADQADSDSDGVGTVCDNCPSNSNASQADYNGNSIGDACDTTQDIISLVGGTGTPGSSGNNGAATSGQLYNPSGVAVDSSGHIFIADTFNNRIQMIAKTTGTFFGQNMTAGRVYTIAGSSIGSLGSSGNGGIATSALLYYPYGVAVDSSGNVYIADTYNSRIQFVPKTSATYFGQSMTANYMYTIIGGTGAGTTGNGGIATSAKLYFPWGVTVDSSGHVYVADTYNSRIQMMPKTSGTYYGQSMTANYAYTIAGNSGGLYGSTGNGGAATSAKLYYPHGIAADASGIYIADTYNSRIQMVPVANGTYFAQSMTANYIYTIAGNSGGVAGSSGNGGIATSARLNYQQGIAVDSAGNIYISDTNNYRIQFVPRTTAMHFNQSMTANYMYTIAGTVSTPNYTGDGGVGTSATIRTTTGIAVDANKTAYISDAGNHRIRKITY